MTDKEKIRAEVERLQDLTMDENKNFYSEAAEGEYNALCNIEHFIDSLQEEPCNHCQGYNNKEECDTLVFGHNCPIVKKPVNEDLEEAAKNHAVERYRVTRDRELAEKCKWSFKSGAKWQEKEDQSTIELAEDHAMLAGMVKMKEQMMKNIWKPSDGDDLPEIDREVIVLLNSGKVVFAHRPYKGKYIGKSLTTGNIETFENKTYGKGGWNQPDVKWWLDCEWPNKEE